MLTDECTPGAAFDVRKDEDDGASREDQPSEHCLPVAGRKPPILRIYRGGVNPHQHFVMGG